MNQNEFAIDYMERWLVVGTVVNFLS